MAEKKTGKVQKPLNPEEKLQQALERDVKIRHLVEHAKHQADATAVAKWEAALTAKDEKASKNRLEKQIRTDSQVVKIITTNSRREKLQRLFHEDELMYEEELNARGLAFRRDRL